MAKKTPKLTDDFYTPIEISRMLKVDKRIIYREVRLERLHAVRVGENIDRIIYRVENAELRRWMSENTERLTKLRKAFEAREKATKKKK